MNSNFKALLSIVPSLMIGGPALAEGSATPSAPQEQAKVPDPMGEIVCQKQEVVGSRLATRRVCMTRLQWREQRTSDRQDTERAQIHPDKQKPGG